MDFTGKKILIADDEADIREIIEYNLSKNGFDVTTARDGDEALELSKKVQPDLIILDIMMPKKSGTQVCEILRANPAFSNTLIIFLTALSDESTHIEGLEMGGDDYLSKPISPKVLVSRVNALFRRSQGAETDSNNILQIENISINADNYEVKVDGNPIILAKKEFELLHLLATKPGRVFLRNEILNQIWGNEVIVGDRTIDVHIRKIRQKLGIDCITTVKGVGYKFQF